MCTSDVNCTAKHASNPNMISFGYLWEFKSVLKNYHQNTPYFWDIYENTAWFSKHYQKNTPVVTNCGELRGGLVMLENWGDFSGKYPKSWTFFFSLISFNQFFSFTRIIHLHVFLAEHSRFCMLYIIIINWFLLVFSFIGTDIERSHKWKELRRAFCEWWLYRMWQWNKWSLCVSQGENIILILILNSKQTRISKFS